MGYGIPSVIANATNSVSLWPGSLAGAFGFRNLLDKTRHHLKTLVLPTIVGAAAGAWLLLITAQRVFDALVPVLILGAAVLLIFQPKVKAMVQNHVPHVPAWAGMLLQFLVSLYGGYFGAGMGIMMLACFAFYMDGTIHELNAVKNWLGVIINFVATLLFVARGIVVADVAVALTLGSVVGGFSVARISQKVDGDLLRKIIAVYGVGMSAYYLYRVVAR